MKRYNASACVLNNQYIFFIGSFFIGGYGSNGYLNDIEKYSIALNSWESIQIASDLKLTLRVECLTFSINSSSILISGGHGKDLKYSYIFDTNHNTLRKSGELPCATYFANSSTLMFRNDFYVVDLEKTIFKFSAGFNEWKMVYKFDIPDDDP